MRARPLASPRAIWLENRQGRRSGKERWTARLILSMVMSSVMVLMVTLLVTFLNLGPRSDFLLLWAKAYAIAWPVAAATAFMIMPGARRLTDRIIARLDGKS
jgi:hypothetical protein